MEEQEKWQSFGGKLASLRIKVILAAFFSLVFLFVVSWIAYHSFQDMLSSVEKLSSPRTETGMINNMIADITEIQAYSTRGIQNNDPVAYENFLEKTAHVHLLIDSLKKEKDIKKYEEKLDTLEIVFEQYIIALNDYFIFLSSTTDASDKNMFGLIKSSESNLKHNSAAFLPKAEIQSVTETVERPVLEPVVLDGKPKKNNRTRKNKKATETDDNAGLSADSISRETTTKIITKVDSSYLFKVDTLLSQMKMSLNNAQTQRTGFQKKISERETEILTRELALMERIRTLLSDIEKEEIEMAQASMNFSKSNAQDSYKKLTILAVIAIGVMLFLVVTLFSDISKSLFYREKLQEAKQEAERLAKVKEEFLANMSHEIRTPLNSIIGFTEQLQDITVVPNSKAKIHAILRSSNHLLSLVNDILDFSKLEAGSLRLEQIGFCYTDVIEEVIEMVESEARRKNLQIVFEPNEASETVLTGDPVRVKQILLNLMSNAVKFTEKGSITIGTEKRTTKNTLWIRCKVMDSGKGIQSSELSKIFKKFEQEDNSITRNYGGTGLGLSISKKLTELQKGKIWAESEVGLGSTFVFEIPFASAEQNDYKLSSTSMEYVPGLLAGKKILVIDDDPMVPEILLPLFEEEKIVSSFCQLPEQACNMIAKEKFDIVFVDLHMPGINGMDMLHKIRNEKNSLNEASITILCTANVIKDVTISTHERIPDYVLYKPYRKKDILNILYKSVNGDKTNLPKTIIEKNTQMTEEFTLKNFKEFAGNDITLLDNFITLFISESEAELKKLDTYLYEKNYKQIGEIAHMFKNTYGQLEARQELNIINKLEGLVKENNHSDEELKHLISGLQQKSKILFSDLKKEMEALKKA